MAIERFPFELAIKDKQLLKPRWDQLSKPQQVALKAFYGLPLEGEELVIWSIFQGGATYDKLGYVTSVTEVPYKPREYDVLNLYVGRRSGKTDMIISTAVAYEITLGGHKKYVKEGQEMKVPFIAQTAGDAQKNMNFIRLALQESPLLKKELLPDQVASEIRLVNGTIVEPLPASKSVGRGHAIPVWVADEMAFWRNEKDSANPDYEVVRAIDYAQLQFPHAKTFIGTTPWAEQGVAWDNFAAGTDGRKLKCDVCTQAKASFCSHPLDDRDEFDGTLVIHASTAAMQNPVITKKRLIKIEKKDPEAFPRESLAQTLKSVAGWLNHDKVDLAVEAGVQKRKPVSGEEPGKPRPQYVAAMDPAFRKDTFAFTILHHDVQLGLVQDYIEYWEPEGGVPLAPGHILDRIKTVLDEYGLSNIYSDQYQLEALQQLAQDRGFSITGYDFTGVSKAKIAGGFKVSLDESRVRLLDSELQTAQLKQLQRQTLQSGNVRIAAPPGKHDDLAMVLMLAARIALWLFPDVVERSEAVKTVDNDHHKMVLEQIERRREEALAAAEDY